MKGGEGGGGWCGICIKLPIYDGEISALNVTDHVRRYVQTYIYERK